MNLIIPSNIKKDLSYFDFKNGNHSLLIKENSHIIMRYASFNKSPNFNLVIRLKKHANLEFYYADFSTGISKINVEIHLDEENANASWHLASLASNNDQKIFDISFFHHAPFTKADMSNSGVSLNSAQLIFSGINHIKKGSYKSETNQSAKIIVFDTKAQGKANPILKIDENDVLASHAAVVGRLNDDHLFYLTSRGLNEKAAKTLIVYGYFKPITNHFDDIYQKKMNQCIKEKCHV